MLSACDRLPHDNSFTAMAWKDGTSKLHHASHQWTPCLSVALQLNMEEHVLWPQRQ